MSLCLNFEYQSCIDFEKLQICNRLSMLEKVPCKTQIWYLHTYIKPTQFFFRFSFCTSFSRKKKHFINCINLFLIMSEVDLQFCTCIYSPCVFQKPVLWFKTKQTKFFLLNIIVFTYSIKDFLFYLQTCPLDCFCVIM